MYAENDFLKGIWLAFTVIAFLLGLFLGRKEYREQQHPDTVTTSDTTWIRDTIYLDKPVTVTKLKTVHDTTYLTSVVNSTDTVLVEVPIDYSHAKYSDAEVYYHGYKAGIDSVAVFPKTVYIENTTYVHDKKPSRWSLGASAGYGITKSGLSPYIGIGIQYDLLRF